MRIGVAALLVIGAFLIAGCQAASGEVFQHSFNRPLVLGDDPVGQTFRSVTGQIAGVDVLVATFDEPVDPAGELRMVLRDATDGRVLARASVDSAELANNTWAPVRFSPPVRAPDVAAFELRWDGSSPLAVWANVPLDQPDEPGEQDALLNDPYLGGQLLRGGDPATGDLAFRVVGAGGLEDVVRTVAGVLGGGARRLADRPLFLGLWLLALACAVSLGVWGLRRSTGQLGDGRRRQQGRDHQKARP